MSSSSSERGAAAPRLVTAADIAVLGGVMARAFHDDPLHRWIFQSEQAWERNSHRSFALAMRQDLRRGTVFTDEGLRAAAIWHEPGIKRSLLERLGFAARMLPLLGRRALTIGKGFDRLEKLRPGEPHWYLYAVGTDPAHQGKGLGSALIRGLLARCDSERRLAYLEASRPENVPYYERFGFAVSRTFEMPGGPTVWCMTRPPGPPGSS